MSKFLAPIHYWLSSKINVMEDIEQTIMTNLNNPAVAAHLAQLKTQFGDHLGDTPLEEVIDQNNIHGWLASKIAATETRQAKLIDYALTQLDPEFVRGSVLAAYHSEGQELGAYRSDNQIKTAPGIFKALNDVLLEGMPCDRVNQITDSQDEAHRWDMIACVHQEYWNQSILRVEDYYAFRAAFSRGFVESITPGFTYAFDNNAGQKHAIFKTL